MKSNPAEKFQEKMAMLLKELHADMLSQRIRDGIKRKKAHHAHK